MVKPVALFVGVLLGCVQAVFTIGHAAPQPVTAISAHYETTTGTSGDYTDPAGNVIQFNQGQDNLLLIDSMTVNGHRLVSDRKADVVRVRRITANTCVDSPGCNTNIGNISGEKLFFQYPYLGSPLEHNLKPPRAHSLEELYRLNALNISADNPLGNLDNNIERIDIMFSEGVRVPETVGGRQLTGFMIAERWGNNPHQIAAIAAVDNQGDPAAFYPLSKGNVNDYGDTQFTITHADGSVTGPANYTPSSHRYRNQDAPVPGGVAGSETNPLNGLPEYFLSTSQPVRAAFHSFEQLGVPAGATVYGFSAFGVDVTQAMDLVGLTDVPLNTDRIIQDSADIFGAVGAVFVPGSQAPIGIAKAVTDQQELEAGVWDVELTLVVENLSSDTPAPNIQVTDDLSATFAGAASFEVMGNPGTGGLTPATPAYDGRDQIQLLAGTDTLAPGDQETIRFRVRVDIGMSDGIYLNSARVTSALAVGEPPASSDWSDEGSDPDPDGDGFANGPGEDDPTAILLGAETGLIAVDKVAGKSQVSIGDLVPYTLTVRNNAGREISEAAVRDTPPPGFSYVEDSAVLVRRGGDGRFGTSDDSSEPLFPEGDRTLVFGPFSLAPGEIVSINYLLRVGAGVVPGEARNVAVPYVAEDPVGPSDAAALEVVRDVTFEQGAIIGVVFHDRDADGYQDAVAATRLRLKVHGIDEFVDTRGVRFLAHEDQLVGGNYAQGFWISHIDGRAYASRSSALRQVQVIIPLKPQTTEGDLFNGLVTLESGEGTWLEGSLLGSNRLEDKRGDVARGVNNQRLAFYGRVQTGERGRFVVLTVVNDAIDEAGIPGVRLATTQGVLIETDAYGRYHLADPMLIEKSRGGNFILKVDPHTLPKDATFTTENPRVMRITGSILNRFNFGVSVPEAEVPTTDAVKRLPAYTRMERQKHIDFNTRFIDEEIGAIQFGSGQSALDAADRAQLAPAIAELTDKSSVEVHATGHADPIPLNARLREIYGDNQGLSEARAREVAAFIREQTGDQSLQVTAEGQGAKAPVASNQTPAGRARNRRVEVQIVYDDVRESWVRVPVEVPARNVIEKRPLVDGGQVWVTEDPAINDPRLNIVSDRYAVVDADGQLADMLSFVAYTNYAQFISQWELTIFAPDDRSLARPVMTYSGDKLRAGMRLDIDRFSADMPELKAGQQLAYKLKVFDDEGHWDETHPRYITVTYDALDNANRVTPEVEEFGHNGLKVQSIPIRGSRVRVYGVAVSERYALTLDGQTLTADGKGAFVSEQYYPMGQHQLMLAYRDADGQTWERALPVDVRGEYMFMVGLANLTIGKNDTRGVLELIEDDEEFDDDAFVNARGAFYLKGKIKGKYLVTAQLDTREEAFRDLDDQLRRRDRTALLRELDPERYYPVYGDDSTAYADVDTQGAYYVRVDWDKSRALWGNFNTDLTANEFAHYSRTLYGAQLVYRKPELTAYGDHKHVLSGFVSEAQSASSHNEFQATGGSLYYLQQQDIVTGSEKIWIEIRERDSTQVLERYALRPGVDYDIDYFQGRIILSRPLSQIARSVAPAIIQDEPLQGDSVFMLVDYEYVPTAFSFDNVVAGVRGKTWVGDALGIGATLVDEERDAQDYALQGVDLTYRLGRGSYVSGEFAQSEASQASSGFSSADGGLTFAPTAASAGDTREGDAVGAEVQLDLAEMSDNRHQGDVRAWYKDRDAGFSSSRDDRGNDTRDRGVHARWRPTDAVQLSVRSKQLDTGEDDSRTTHSVQIDSDITEKLAAGLEVQRSERIRAGGPEENATLAGGRITYRFLADTQLYAKAQSQVAANDAYSDNDQYALGVNHRHSESLSFGGEAVTGDRGDGLIVGMDYRVSQRAGMSVSAGFGDQADSLVTADYTLENGLNLYGSFARTEADNQPEKTSYTLGQRKAFGNRLEVFAENQLSDSDAQTGLTHVFGIDYNLSRSTGLEFSLQRSTIEQTDADDISRHAATAGIYVRRDRTRLSTRLEYRRDRSAIDSTQWLSVSAFEWKQTRDYRWLGRLHYSITRDDNDDTDLARFTEASVGFAYRPALHDRFNWLSRVTWLEDLPTIGQDASAVDERAWVLATEGAYALTSRWEVGGKLAGKRAELRQQRGEGSWYSADTRFYAARLRYHLIKHWDAFGEYRWLETREDRTQRAGALLALYRHVGEHLKLGLGFNFTDFNDDLTDLDYDNRGWFLDITAKY